MRFAILLSLFLSGASFGQGRFDRFNQRTDQGRSSRGFSQSSGAFLEFAPTSGAGMGVACAGTTPTGAKGEAISFARTTVGECYSNDGQTLTQVGVNVPRVSSGTAASSVLGIWKEPARTNVALHSRDLSQAVWAKTSMTCTRTATGMRNDANGASRCTSSAANGTVLQSITYAAFTANTSFHIKRVTGTGTVQVTRDNGVTWSTVTGPSTTLWKRVHAPGLTAANGDVPGCAGGNCIPIAALTSGIANPTIGIRLVTSGDAVDVDFVQDEETAVPSSPIATAGTATPRDYDVIDLPAVISPTATTGISVSSVGVSGGPFNTGHTAVQTILTTGSLGTLALGATYAWNYASTTGGLVAIDTAGTVSAGTASWNPMYSAWSELATQTGFWHTGALLRDCQRNVCDVGSASTLGTPAFTRVMLGRASGAANSQFSGVIKQVCVDASGRCTPTRTGPVVWVGDSIVYGNASLPLDPPSRLTDLQPTRPVINAGVGGNGVASCGARYLANYTGVQTLIWSCGVNDLATGSAGATLATAAQVFLADARSRGIKVIVTEITPWKNSTGWTLAKQTETDAYDASMTAWASANGATWVATQPTMGGGGGDADVIAVAYESAALDKIHINSAGALQLATLVFAASP